MNKRFNSKFNKRPSKENVIVREDTIILSVSGVKKLEEELEFLTFTKRRELFEERGRSLEKGEKSTPSIEDTQLLLSIDMNECRIKNIADILKRAVVMSEEELSVDVVRCGHVVELLDKINNEKMTMRLLSGIEADPFKDELSIDSPLGQLIIGSKKGSSVSSSPKATIHLEVEILNISVV